MRRKTVLLHINVPTGTYCYNRYDDGHDMCENLLLDAEGNPLCRHGFKYIVRISGGYAKPNSCYHLPEKETK